MDGCTAVQAWEGTLPLKMDPRKGFKEKRARSYSCFTRITVTIVLRSNEIWHVKHLVQLRAHHKHLVMVSFFLLLLLLLLLIIIPFGGITIIIIIIYFDVNTLIKRHIQGCTLLVLHLGPSVILHLQVKSSRVVGTSKFNNWGTLLKTPSALQLKPQVLQPLCLSFSRSSHCLLAQANKSRYKELPVVQEPDRKFFSGNDIFLSTFISGPSSSSWFCFPWFCFITKRCSGSGWKSCP